MSLKKTGCRCVIPNCSGEIVIKKTMIGDTSNMKTIGPISKKEIHTQSKTQIYCEKCGVLYHHLPKN